MVAHNRIGRRPKRRAGARPHPAVRGVRRPDRRHRHDHRTGPETAKRRSTTCRRSPRSFGRTRSTSSRGQFIEGDTVLAAGRSGVAARRHAGPFGHPPGARRAASGARAPTLCRRVAQQARLPAVRLQLAGRAVGRPAAGDRGRHQRGRRGRLPGEHVHHRTRQGQGDGRDGAVRRELRRRGAGRRDRRTVLDGAVRRHARAALVAGRPGHLARRIVGRVGRAPRRGLRRARLPSATWRRSARCWPGWRRR